MAHANARLGPAGRRQLVGLMIDEGMSERQAAACLSVSSCTAHRWKRRWLEAGDGERGCGRWALDRSSRPHRSPARTAADVEQRVLAERERTGWGPRLIAGSTGVAHSTVHAILKRHGRSRAPQAPREGFRRYEWPCPGDLLHMDIKRYRRFRRPGHPFIADERQTSKEIDTQLGYDYLHAVIDDHSRLAYAELLAGTVLTETIFSWPGMGQFFVNAFGNGDYPQVLAWVMVTVASVIIFNLLVDVVYAFLDPRIRYA
jgi:transposase